MKDKWIRDYFEQETEIPEEVTQAMEKAYREVGGSTERGIHVTPMRRPRRRYLKAAGLILCLCAATAVTAAAATNGGFAVLGKLFRGDTDLIRSSSTEPETKKEVNTFKNLEIKLEQITGTEDLTYFVLHLRRTDGKLFNKDSEYSFMTTEVTGEKDVDWDAIQREAERFGQEGKEDDREISSDTYQNTGIVIENEGTDELRLAVIGGYEQNENGVVTYHQGQKCVLKLVGLREGAPIAGTQLHEENPEMGEDEIIMAGNAVIEEGAPIAGTQLQEGNPGMGEDEIIMAGNAVIEFEMNYGKADKRVLQCGEEISFPQFNGGSYVKEGILQSVTLTPYYVKYEIDQSESQFMGDTWEQIYLEMEDGSMIGNRTEKEYLKEEKASEDEGEIRFQGGYGHGDFDEKAGVNHMEKVILSSGVIDLEKVRAIHFGKSRFEVK